MTDISCIEGGFILGNRFVVNTKKAEVNTRCWIECEVCLQMKSYVWWCISTFCSCR